jgi:uncharacterized phage protein (TIGR01671 family)
MRPIKFRVWDGLNLHHITPEEELQIVFGAEQQTWSVWSPYEMVIDSSDKDAVLMQYTDLTDRTGKEIYEGDVVEFNDFDSLRTGGHTDDNIIQGNVCFSCGAWIVKSQKGHYDLYSATINDEELEIIGNIYEDSHLLESDTMCN